MNVALRITTMNAHLEDTIKTPKTDESQIISTEVEAEPSEKVTVEEFKISGDALVTKIKDLIHQGNIRRIIIKNENGYTLIEIPMTVGVIGGAIGTVLFPVVAALGVIGAMVTHLTVVIERRESNPPNTDGKKPNNTP